MGGSWRFAQPCPLSLRPIIGLRLRPHGSIRTVPRRRRSETEPKPWKGVKWFYNLIGPNRFERRFDLFRSLEASGLLPPFARDNHPVEYGIYLCIEHPASVKHVPAGYLTWADQFCGLVHDFKRRHNKREWKLLRRDILSGLGVADGGNHDSLNAVFFQLRFGWLFGPTGQFAPALPGCEMVLGKETGVTTDYILNTPTRSFGLDCKSLRNGPLRSNWDHHLTRALLTNPAIKKFLEFGTGTALLTTPRLDFLCGPAGAASLAADIEDLFATRVAGQRVLVNREFFPEVRHSPEAARRFVGERCPVGHSHQLLSLHVSSGGSGSVERPAYLACYTPDDLEAFACNVQRAARKVISKQAAPDEPAIVAFNADFITALRADTVNPKDARDNSRSAIIYLIQKALLEDEVCRRLYGVLFWFDPHLQSSEAWTTDIGVELLFWKNRHSLYNREPVPSPLDRVHQLTLDPTESAHTAV